MAHTLLSTSPVASPSSRTAPSPRSVATPELRFGHATHSPPAGVRAFLHAGRRRSSSERATKKATITSKEPCRRRRTDTPGGSSPSTCSNPSGASIRPSCASGLIPSLRGSGVPE